MKKTKKLISIVMASCMFLSTFQNQNINIVKAASDDDIITLDNEEVDYSEYETISSPKDLDKLNKVANGKYVLTEDIDMSKYPGSYTPAKDFRGVLDGNGHTITGMSSALIEAVNGHAEIYNLILYECNYVDDTEGALVNSVNGSINIDNVKVNVEGKIYAGLCGSIESSPKSKSIIKKCRVNIKQNNIDWSTYTKYVGGIVGLVDLKEYSLIDISDCNININYNRNDDGWTNYVGGVIGALYNNSSDIFINECNIEGEISGSKNAGGIIAGGIIGDLQSDGDVKITNCINTSSLYYNYKNAGTCVGGCIGNIYRGDVTIENFIDISKKRTGNYTGVLIGKENEDNNIMLDIKNTYYYNKIYDEIKKEYIVDDKLTSLNDMQLCEKSSFSGFDFFDIFACEKGVNDSRIMLRCLADIYSVSSPVITEEEDDDGNRYISMSHPSDSAKIIYSIISEDNTAKNVEYDSPIPITGNTYITAIAQIEGYNDSEPATYDSTFKVSMPEVKVETISDTCKEVYLTCEEDDCEIYYTTDDSEPTLQSQIYTSPITISSTTVIKAVAVKTGYASSDVLVYQVNIESEPTPEPTPTDTLDDKQDDVPNNADDDYDDDDTWYIPPITTSVPDYIPYTPIITPKPVNNITPTPSPASKISIGKVKLKKMKVTKNKWYLTGNKLNNVDGYETYIEHWEMFSKDVKPKRTHSIVRLKGTKPAWCGYYRLLYVNKLNYHSNSFVAFRIKVRGYKKVGDKYYYGKWSSWKNIISKSKARKLCDPFDSGKGVKVINK